MSRRRFTITGLMAVVLFLAVGMAALKNPTELWASAIFTAVLGLLLFAVLGVSFGRGAVRRHWAGFGVFGWGYLCFVFTTTSLPPPPPASTKLFKLLERPVSPPPAKQAMIMKADYIRMDATVIYLNGKMMQPSSGSPPPDDSESLALHQFGHSLAAVMIALLGAVSVRLMGGPIEVRGQEEVDV